MNKIVIIEDEALSAKRLIRLINDYDDSITILGPFQTTDEVKNFLASDHDYDLIISDIRLGAYTVFEAFELNMLTSFVIFTTTYDEYAMNAIKSNGIDYLLKPVNSKELFNSLDKINMLLHQDTTPTALSVVARDMQIWRSRFLVTKGDELVSLKADEISCIYSGKRQVVAYKHDGETYVMSDKLSDLEETLNPDVFFRINRQYIANINYLEKISFFFSSKLHVKIKGCNDSNIIISKDKACKFKQWLSK